MPVQRGRDVHIWRLPATNAVTRMALPSPRVGRGWSGDYFPERQVVTHPTPAPPLHGRGVAGAQGLFRSLGV